jgi:hypothetical protein
MSINHMIGMRENNVTTDLKKGVKSAFKIEKKKKMIRDYLALKYYRYEVTTALYMLEPWEKALFSTFICFLSKILRS